jgi:signal transduction histidine kinase
MVGGWSRHRERLSMAHRWHLSGIGSPIAIPSGETAAAQRAALALALASGAAGLTLLLFTHEGSRPLDPLAFVLFPVLVVLARVQGAAPFERSSFALSVVPILAAGMVVGVRGTAMAALAGAMAHAAVRRPPWHRALINCGTDVLAASLAALVFGFAGCALVPDNAPRLAVIGAVVGLVHYLRAFLVALGVGIEHHTPPQRTWADQLAWLWPQSAVVGVAAAFLALAYTQLGGWGVAAFMAPPAVVLLMARQDVGRTGESVPELRRLNDELHALNRELRDEIRQRELAEAENARLAREAARAAALQEANELKSRFISIASHELRTPLTMLSGYTELILAETTPDDPRHEMLACAHQGAVELAELVENLLDASRIELGKMEIRPVVVDLDATVEAVLEGLRTGTERHTLVAAVDPDARWVRADPARLRQILLNLVGHAIKYSPGGGEVRVGAHAVDALVEISVADHGIGIAPDELGRIFDPYQRATPSSNAQIKGTGLGLYIVRNLVELHGGTVRVESQRGRGSTFVVTLPIASLADLAAEEAAG